MPTEWSSLVCQISGVKIYNYFKKRSMPEFVEPVVTQLVDLFEAAAESERRQWPSAIPREAIHVFGWYARKLAGRAVREQQVMDVRRGLLALAIYASASDWRDAMSPLALLYNSALRLNEDPRALFESACDKCSQSVRDLFQGFLNRPPELKSIKTFGFAEGTGPYGFDYLPLLPEFGGPNPLQG
jgi:hypothetical protein